ncbi:MAG TPA: lipase family protein [Acidimicrobiales bacterium]|nr:lipase family protein [Acidimicrobiales bacterium]
MRRVLVLALAVAVVAAACSGADPGDAGDTGDTGDEETSTTGAEVAAGELPTDVRSVPDPLPPGDPGDLVALAPRQGPDVPAGARAWDVLYRSEGVDGDPVAVSGRVYAPAEGAGENGDRVVVSWAHGTTGVADDCAPSRTGDPVPALARLLDAGYVVAATDYEGLGTPGVHPYLVGASEGRSVLDAARAATRIEGTNAGSRVVLGGHSQGGHAALFAGGMVDGYAPDLELVGVAASAPAAELTTLLRSAVPISLAFGLVASAVYAYEATYDELVLEEVLTPAAVERIGVVDEVCLDEVTDAFAGERTSAWLAANPLDVEAWAVRVAENEPGSMAIPAPVLVTQGTVDFVVLASSTDTAVARLCDGPNTVEYRRYPGAGHGDLLAEAGDDVLAWVAERVAGINAPSTCGG